MDKFNKDDVEEDTCPERGISYDSRRMCKLDNTECLNPIRLHRACSKYITKYGMDTEQRTIWKRG